MSGKTARLHRLPLVDLARQHRNLKVDLDSAISRVFASSQFILGQETKEFEREFAAFCGAGAAVACGNGTDALELALWAIGVRPGDEVITVANTFAATAEAIVRAGAVPRFVDVDPASLLMNLAHVEAAITNKTAAIVPVHLFGSCVDMAALMALVRSRGIKVVEDAAQAHGARINGRRAGASADAGCFSFYPGKNLGACGDAGAVVTSDPEVEARVRMARDHGRSAKYNHAIVGRNSRMDALQAAILRAKLPHVDDWNRRRRAQAARYRSLLLGAPDLEIVESTQPGEPVHHLMVVKSGRRERIREALAAVGIETGVHYPIPLHMQPAFAGSAPLGSLPITEGAADRILSLPIFPEMTDSEVDLVVETVCSAISSAVE